MKPIGGHVLLRNICSSSILGKPVSEVLRQELRAELVRKFELLAEWPEFDY